MKKAFDDNLPRMKPRLRLQSEPNGSPSSPLDDGADERPRVTSSVDVKAAVEAALSEDPRAAPAGFSAPDRASRTDDRAEQRRRLRRRLAALGSEPKPLAPDSPRATATLLSAAEGVAGDLTEARARGDRLETELLRARADLERALAEVTHHRRLEEDSSRRLEESQAVLGAMETELSMLEEERDEVLFEVRALRGRDADRQESLQSLSAELDRVRKELAESQAERVELVHELEEEEERDAALGRELTRLETERARWAEQVSEATGARGALADSRRTLEEVHRVLALARSRAPRP